MAFLLSTYNKVMFTKFAKKTALPILLIFALVLINTGCKKNKLKIDVSDIKVDVPFRRFDKDLLAFDTGKPAESFKSLENKYPGFFPSYYQDIVSLGDIDDTTAPQNLKLFLAFPPTRQLNELVQKKFPDVAEYNEKITEAYKHYKYYFPNDTLPEIIYFTGIINYATVYYGPSIAVGLDMYLNNDTLYKKMPHLFNYLTVKMRPEYIHRNVMNALGNYRFQKYTPGKRFIDRMIFEGKIAYFLDAMMPETPDSIKLGFTHRNLEWTKKNEWQIWQNMVDPKTKVLYSTETELITRYFEEGPFTNAYNVPPESAPRFAVWTGWQIVRKYMDSNPKMTLDQLMRETDSDKILRESKYKP